MSHSLFRPSYPNNSVNLGGEFLVSDYNMTMTFSDAAGNNASCVVKLSVKGRGRLDRGQALYSANDVVRVRSFPSQDY